MRREREGRDRQIDRDRNKQIKTEIGRNRAQLGGGVEAVGGGGVQLLSYATRAVYISGVWRLFICLQILFLLLSVFFFWGGEVGGGG